MPKEKVKKLYRVRTPYSVKFITSGADVLDCALGGGWACGRIANLVGDRSTGKTLLALEVVAAILKTPNLRTILDSMGKTKVKVVYNAAEGAVDFDLQLMYSLDRSSVHWEYSDTVEEFDKHVSDELDDLSDDTFLLYVLDSLDTLSSEEERKFDKKKHKAMGKEEKESGKKEKGTYGVGKAALMNRFFRRNALKIAQKGALLLIISQTRQNIGVRFGPKKKRSSADALDFYEAQELWTAETQQMGKKIGKKKRIVGIRIRCRVKKLKVGLPHREADLVILLNYGVDNVGSNIDFLFDLVDGWGRQKKGIGKTLDWNGKKYTREGLVARIAGDTRQEIKLSKHVKMVWREIEKAVEHGRPSKY